jgi:hypothetical protein
MNICSNKLSQHGAIFNTNLSSKKKKYSVQLPKFDDDLEKDNN